jgi:hypothetical protein
MDIIHDCISLVPVPYLRPAFSIFRSIWASIDEVQQSKEQLRVLADCIAHLLKTLDTEYRTGRLIKTKTSKALEDLYRCAIRHGSRICSAHPYLCSLLQEISCFAHTQAAYGFVKLLVSKDKRLAAIQVYHRKVASFVDAFQVYSLTPYNHGFRPSYDFASRSRP